MEPHLYEDKMHFSCFVVVYPFAKATLPSSKIQTESVRIANVLNVRHWITTHLVLKLEAECWITNSDPTSGFRILTSDI